MEPFFGFDMEMYSARIQRNEFDYGGFYGVQRASSSAVWLFEGFLDKGHGMRSKVTSLSTRETSKTSFGICCIKRLFQRAFQKLIGAF